MTTSDAVHILAGLAILAIAAWINWQQYGHLIGEPTGYMSKIIGLPVHLNQKQPCFMPFLSVLWVVF